MMSSCSFASGNSSRNSAEQRHICTRVLAAVPRQLQIFVARSVWGCTEARRLHVYCYIEAARLNNNSYLDRPKAP